MITVKLNIKDYPNGIFEEPEYWCDYINTKLAEAGIPFLNGKVINGTIHRQDDPNDFGSSTYTYIEGSE